MSGAALVILVLVALFVSGTTVLIVTASGRLRAEIDRLFATFAQTEPTLTPLRVAVESERTLLMNRLEHLADPRSGPDADPR